jgi:hypothetical protein
MITDPAYVDRKRASRVKAYQKVCADPERLEKAREAARDWYHRKRGSHPDEC